MTRFVNGIVNNLYNNCLDFNYAVLGNNTFDQDVFRSDMNHFIVCFPIGICRLYVVL